MIAVYKRELRSYLTSMIGYLFIFFILFLTVQSIAKRRWN